LAAVIELLGCILLSICASLLRLGYEIEEEGRPMKVTLIDPHLIQLTQRGAINCYLVREEDGFTLADTCLRGAHRFILEFAAQARSP
jgi:hypothetical protein